MGVVPEVKVKVVRLVLQRFTALELDGLAGRNQKVKEHAYSEWWCGGWSGNGVEEMVEKELVVRVVGIVVSVGG